MSFQKVLDKYRKISFSEQDKGARFERLMQSYLQTDPKYAYLFKKIWLWNEFPGKLDFGSGDTGIDLVALTTKGDYWAIQCKCFQENSTIDKPAVDSFLSTSGREFKNENLQTTRFSQRLWISTTNKWGPNAEEAIRNQIPPLTRINLHDLQQAPVDWEKLDKGIHGEASRTPKKILFPHQEEAVSKAHEYFKTTDRGKMIMACGTGKTFTSLRIAEKEADGNGLILFLVPSIALLGQALREWSTDAYEPINAICICSDSKISRKKTKNVDTDNFSTVDLALPASTNTKNIINQFENSKNNDNSGMTVVFSTYQSIDVIAEAQKELIKNGFNEFDLIICDEAHRTTGVTLVDEDESSFTKVHDDNFINSKKRLYMTATPRLYSDDVKSKAAEAEAILCSMDDAKIYGEEIYRIGFGEAVERDLLTDYKVLILTLNDQDVPLSVQNMVANKEAEINTDDASKLIGCVNALSKQFLGDEGKTKESDPEPMKLGVAFCQNISVSKKITNIFNSITETYLKTLPAEKKEQMVSLESKHIDGSMNAPQRDELMNWLQTPTDNNECRILNNVRCLSEGVDVPSLDAVLFLSARNSQVDVVQSVGRVMRKSPGKKYGYIIIPVVVPSDVEPDKALDDNERYKVVWTVLNALRAHDDRFNATVNKIELNRKRPEQILVGRPEYSFDSDGNPLSADEDTANNYSKTVSKQMALKFEQLQNVVFARMVQKVGDKRYWEQWAKDVAVIAERQIERIEYLISQRSDQRDSFDKFLSGLQKNINPSITERQAVEMLAQHIITKPIFEALFKGYSFVDSNVVSNSMQSMLNALEGETIEENHYTLQKFYDSVRKRAEGIDNAEGKQKIITELYDKFFKTAFPKMVEQLGIVYTPIEIVDFIVNSIDEILQKEFNRSISDENIHILDPFVGTGMFMTRLLQCGLIKTKDLERKYKKELHANEIVLLAYYIAAVNIENAYHDQLKENSEYQPFEGIVLTDTFQLSETDENEALFSEIFPKNSERVVKQKKAPIRVIMGNPPYSIGQKSENDNASNQVYEKLNHRISTTYVKESSAGLKNSMYDSYVKAFRWSTDRLDPENGGIIAFVSNGSWIDGNAADGFRKVLEKEFSKIWVFNTRGNARTQGELRRKEAGNIFGGGTRTPISITFLVNNPNSNTEKSTIKYFDIGDYLSRADKLKIIYELNSILNNKINWEIIKPNKYGDWINKRNSLFEEFISIGDKKEKKTNSYFMPFFSNGIKTQRDAWCYNSSRNAVQTNMSRMIEFYNEQLDKLNEKKKSSPIIDIDDFIDTNQKKINWTVNLKKDIKKGVAHNYKNELLKHAIYRPFFKQVLYFDTSFIERPGLNSNLFPTTETKNLVICTPSPGDNKDFTSLIVDTCCDYGLLGGTQCFPLYYYETKTSNNRTFFDTSEENGYIRKDGITDFILERAVEKYGRNVIKDDIFYYVYGLLHSPDYISSFANDLKKTLSRIPLVEDKDDFWKFSESGRKLADLHINYEEIPPHDGVKVQGDDSRFYRVEKMRFPKRNQKDTIIYNSKITISNIPDKAYEYKINGKSAIEWIMDRYQIKVDKNSGIKNDPNDWAEEVENPRYILDLLLSVINVSVQTVDIVKGLPKLKFD